jgi:hypothetical protein
MSGWKQNYPRRRALLLATYDKRQYLADRRSLVGTDLNNSSITVSVALWPHWESVVQSRAQPLPRTGSVFAMPTYTQRISHAQHGDAGKPPPPRLDQSFLEYVLSGPGGIKILNLN